MRMLLKWKSGLEATNGAVRTGKMREINQSLEERTQPEAAYFCMENGHRTAHIFFDLADPSQIAVIAEPLFQDVSTTVEFIPVMTTVELRRGLAQASLV